MAFSGRLGLAGTICGVLGIIGGGIAQIRPLWGDTVNAILWYVSASIFSLVVIIGLIRAPYLVHREDVEEANKVKDEKAELERQLDEKIRKRKMRDALGIFLAEGQKLSASCAKEREPPPIDEANEWSSDVERYLSQELGMSYVAIFYNTAGVPVGVSSILSIPHRSLASSIRARLYQLEQILKQLGD